MQSVAWILFGLVPLHRSTCYRSGFVGGLVIKSIQPPQQNYRTLSLWMAIAECVQTRCHHCGMTIHLKLYIFPLKQIPKRTYLLVLVRTDIRFVTRHVVSSASQDSSSNLFGPLRPMSISSSKAPSNDESQGKEIEGGATGRATGVRRCWITPLVNMVGEVELHNVFIIDISTDI